MGFYSKAVGAMIALAIVGGGTAYLAKEGSSMIADAQAMVDEISGMYLIKAEIGLLSLYEDGSSEPLMQYAIPQGYIPAADIALLEDGIRLRGMADVMRLLEDLEVESVIPTE